jgi:hypothetical protein
MHAPLSTSTRAIRQFRARWRLGRFVAAFATTAAIVLLALTFLAGLDALTGFTDPVRRIVFAALALTAVIGALIAVWRSMRIHDRNAAMQADRSLDSSRRDVLNSLDLSRAPADPGTLGRWLQDRLQDRVGTALNAVTFTRSIPIGELVRAGWQFAAVVVLGVLFFVFSPGAAKTCFARLLAPGADIPPYSNLVFNLQPNPAKTLYGEDFIAHASIDGARIEGPVSCFARDPATQRRFEIPTFYEGDNRYAGKLERLTTNVEVAFSVGRARSRWLPVEVLLQPRITNVTIRIEPPQYAALQPATIEPGVQDLAPLPGSRLMATLISNRPLSGGELTLTSGSADTAAKPTVVAGRPASLSGSHTVEFEWTSRAIPSDLRFVVRDSQGVASESLSVRQKVTTDERPQISLIEPAGDVYATPDSTLPIEVTAEDDLGLSQISWVRSLVGYRERSAEQELAPGIREKSLSTRMPLAPLALVPGQTITLALEGRDTNPNLFGLAVSDVARVHIISREQYAEVLRSRATLEEFAGRYGALQDALDAARKSLEQLGEAARSGDAKPLAEALETARTAHQNLQQLLDQLHKDFPTFDLDSRLGQASGEAGEFVAQNLTDLRAMSDAQSALARVNAMQERLGEGQKRLEPTLQSARLAEQAGRVFEQIGKFVDLVKEQRSLVKNLDRLTEQIRRGETTSTEAIHAMGVRQQEISNNLDTLETELGRALLMLPSESLGKLKNEGRQFLNAMREVDAQLEMGLSTEAADRGEPRTAGEQANLALAKLESLIRSNNCMGGMCRGEEPDFPWPTDANTTIAQLMRALCRKPGADSGDDSTGGPGAGWVSDSGYVSQGNMPQIPIFGPDRLSFQKAVSGGHGREGRGRGEGSTAQTISGASPQPGNTTTDASSNGPSDLVPAAYRDAVKKYFSDQPNNQP